MTIQKLQTVTVIASAAISRNRFVGWTGAHSTSVDDVLGLSEAPAAIGGAVSVVTKYSAPVEAAGAINVGDYVAPANDGTGRAVAGNVINNCGRALVGASGVGSIAVVAVFGSERGGSVSGAWNGPQLLTVTVGNSINAAANASATQRNNSAGADPTGWWNTGSEVHFANALCGAPLRFCRITATTRADKWGNYAYSGATLATINADLATQLYAALDTASIKPDLVIAVDLLANDIGQGRTYAQCVADLKQWLYTTQGRYPTARLLINTPHPSYSYDTAAKVLVYQQMRDYILALDNGRTIFASRADVYESPSSPGTPQAGYTDASVHPTTAGGTMIARLGMLPTLRRIATAALPAYRCTSANFALTGTGAASGTNVTGTVPTGVSTTGAANAIAVTLSADQPGCTYQIAKAAGAALDDGSLNVGQHTVSGYTQYAPYLVVRINSGAENLRGLWLQSRCTDGSTLPFVNFGSAATSDADPYVGAYQNGDVLTLRSPIITQVDAGTAGAFTSIYTYLRMVQRTGGTSVSLAAGTVSVTILDVGVGLVA